jgi:AraC-like DNA-binding protein
LRESSQTSQKRIPIWNPAGLLRHLLQIRDEISAITRVGHSSIGTRFAGTIAAAEIGLSPTHFCTAFKQSTGHSPHRYLLNRKVVRAKQPMAELTEIALISGFKSSGQFATTFRRIDGPTPSCISPKLVRRPRATTRITTKSIQQRKTLMKALGMAHETTDRSLPSTPSITEMAPPRGTAKAASRRFIQTAARRAALMRLIRVDSKTTRRFRIDEIKSSLLTTQSRFLLDEQVEDLRRYRHQRPALSF